MVVKNDSFFFAKFIRWHDDTGGNLPGAHPLLPTPEGADVLPLAAEPADGAALAGDSGAGFVSIIYFTFCSYL